MIRTLLTSALLLCIIVTASGQNNTSLQSIDSLKRQIIELQASVDHIQLNLGQAQNKFQRGIAVASIGYSVTIAGGLLLGRSQDKVGQVLLVAGGVTGITGTFMLVDSFKYLGRASRKAQK